MHFIPTTKEEENKNIEATKVELKSTKTIEKITKDDETYETPDDQSQNIIQEEEKDIKETEEEKTVPVDETKKKKEFFSNLLNDWCSLLVLYGIQMIGWQCLKGSHCQPNQHPVAAVHW